jgi:uncharacterized protein
MHCDAGLDNAPTRAGHSAKPIILALGCVASGALPAALPAPAEAPIAVKFQPDVLAGTNVITRHDADALWVGSQRFAHSLLVPWQGAVLPWAPMRPDDLEAAHFEAILALQPELVIFGSGPRLKFVAPALLRALIDRRIGVETMDTPAACRTYNVLVSEGRSAVAALLMAAPA